MASYHLNIVVRWEDRCSSWKAFLVHEVGSSPGSKERPWPRKRRPLVVSSGTPHDFFSKHERSSKVENELHNQLVLSKQLVPTYTDPEQKWQLTNWIELPESARAGLIIKLLCHVVFLCAC